MPAESVPRHFDDDADITTGASIDKYLTDGASYEATIMSIDIVEHSTLVKKAPVAALKQFFSAFAHLVFSVIVARRGAAVSWTPDGGMFMFWHDAHARDAILASIALLRQLDVFNYDSATNPLGEPIRLRIAVAYGLLVYRRPATTTFAAVINYAKHLESKFTAPNELTAEEGVVERLDGILADAFSFKGFFEGTKVFRHQPEHEEQQLTDEEVSNLAADVAFRCETIRSQLASSSSADASALSVALDDVYSSLGRFAQMFPRIDDRWRPEYLQWVAATATALLDAEKRVYEALIEACAGVQVGSSRHREMSALIQIAGSRRTTIAVSLVPIKAQAERRVAKAKEAGLRSDEMRASTVASIIQARVDPEFQEAVRALIEADDLREEMAFVELLTKRRADLVAFLVAGTESAQRTCLVERLWSLADLVLVEDLFRGSGVTRRSNPRVFAALLSAADSGPRFRLVQRLLELREPPTTAVVESTCATLGLTASSELSSVVWRCLLVAHADWAGRVRAAEHVPTAALWRTIAYPKVSVATIHAVAECVAQREGDGIKKLFFDCVRARLRSEVMDRGPEFPHIRRLLEVFYSAFNCFLESNYFERLEELLECYRHEALHVGERLEFLDTASRSLDRIRVMAGNPGAKTPTEVRKLPLAIQRHLARAGEHLDHFVLHPDERIAGETVRHVTLANVEQLLRYREINSFVMRSILGDEAFFTRSSTTVLALNHPKCTLPFADKYLRQIGARELERLVGNRNALSAIREKAKRALSSSRRA